VVAFGHPCPRQSGLRASRLRRLALRPWPFRPTRARKAGANARVRDGRPALGPAEGTT